MSNDKAIASNSNLSPESLKEAFGGYTGSDYSSGGSGYPYLTILQKNSTTDNFNDANEIAQGDYGKIYVRQSVNSRNDLMDSVQGVVIKEQKGAELWVEGQCVFTANHFVNAEEKSELALKHNCEPHDVKNVIKVLVRLVKPVKNATGDDITHAVFTVKGASFMPYNKQVKEKQQLLFTKSGQFMEMGIRAVEDVPVVFWLLNITSDLVVDNQRNRSYFTYKFDVKEMPAEKAFTLKDDMVQVASFDLISMSEMSEKKETLESKSVVNESAKQVEVIEKMESGDDEVVEGDFIDPEDLPF